MKGIVLAGGLGSRLYPLTRVTNKHLLPVYDRPMIYYPIQTLLNAGIGEILMVTGGEHAGDFLKLLGNGKALGIRDLQYTYQEGEGGIAEALLLAEDFADGGTRPWASSATSPGGRESCSRRSITRSGSAFPGSRAIGSSKSSRSRPTRPAASR
jgi:hypothetical protein